MSASLPLSVRPVDRKRLDSLNHRTETPLESADITRTQKPSAGSAPTAISAFPWSQATLRTHTAALSLHSVGLPYGPKPRLFQSYICMKAIKHQSPVVPVERSMSDMMHVLGLAVTGGKNGTIRMFKEQIICFAACHFTIVGPGPNGMKLSSNILPHQGFACRSSWSGWLQVSSNQRVTARGAIHLDQVAGRLPKA
jgi:hypothetical protein